MGEGLRTKPRHNKHNVAGQEGDGSEMKQQSRRLGHESQVSRPSNKVDASCREELVVDSEDLPDDDEEEEDDDEEEEYADENAALLEESQTMD